MISLQHANKKNIDGDSHLATVSRIRFALVHQTQTNFDEKATGDMKKNNAGTTIRSTESGFWPSGRQSAGDCGDAAVCDGCMYLSIDDDGVYTNSRSAARRG